MKTLFRKGGKFGAVMSRRRPVAGFLFLAPVALGVLLAALVVTERRAPGDDGERLHIRGVTYLGDLPTLVADKRGLFEAEGVKPVVKYGFSGKHNLELLRAGETDFALMALTPLVTDWLNDDSPGQPDDPVILASLVHATNLNHVVSLSRRNLTRPADLSGRRVGVMKGTNAEFVWWLFATYHGLDHDSVELVDQPVDVITDALLAGDIDAAVLWEPWTTRLRQRIGDGVWIYPGSNVYTARWVIVALRQTVADRPNQSRALLGAYRSAIELIDRRGDEALAIFADHAGVSIDSLNRLRTQLSFELSLDWSIVSSLQQQIDWAREAGYTDADGIHDVLALLDTDPLRFVAPASVGLPVRGGDTEPDAP